MDIISKKWFYFLFSGLIILPGLMSLLVFGLKLSIDFTGGTLLELKFEKTVDKAKIEQTAKDLKIELSSIQSSGENTFLLRSKPIDKDQNQNFQKTLNENLGKVTEQRLETVGPTIGRELAQKAILAVIFASIGIILYLAWSFKEVPRPASSWRFGICAVIALLHDVLVVTGLFSIFGHLYKVEIDSLFVTALLTVIGFSVHDTIVVFDRIRENLKKNPGRKFAEVVNDSILQTLSRSLSTTLTVVFTLLALLLFGGETIKWFVTALLIGIVSGTYSSIFNASPLLVVWQEWEERRNKKHHGGNHG